MELDGTHGGSLTIVDVIDANNINTTPVQHQSYLPCHSSYLPDLLPVQAHDLLQQNIAAVTAPSGLTANSSLHVESERPALHSTFSASLGRSTASGPTANIPPQSAIPYNPVLETLQPIRKEEIVRLRNDGGSVTIVETQLISKHEKVL